MLARRWPPGLRLPLAAMALLLFLCLAGVQPSVVRAVLMAPMALLICQSGHHSRPVGVLVLTLSGMLLLRPAWALSIGFQLSAAATAGLILTAPRLEQAVQAWLPDRCQGLAEALSIPVAALLWTLPLQLLHFGAMPLYALLANLLVAPLLAPLTLLAMLSALLVLLGPTAVLALLLWPVHQLAGLVITMASWISYWPGAQLLTGRPQGWVIALFVLGLLPWLLGAGPCRRCWSLIPLAIALFAHGLLQFGDGLARRGAFRVGLDERHFVDVFARGEDRVGRNINAARPRLQTSDGIHDSRRVDDVEAGRVYHTAPFFARDRFCDSVSVLEAVRGYLTHARIAFKRRGRHAAVQ